MYLGLSQLLLHFLLHIFGCDKILYLIFHLLWSQGIWTTNPRIVLTLGEDVSGSLRSPADFEEQAPGSDGSGKPTASRTGDGSVTTPVRGRLPAGLKNLGATCYLNSQLQALFANRAFRAGVYSWRSCSPRGGGCVCAPLLNFFLCAAVVFRGISRGSDCDCVFYLRYVSEYSSLTNSGQHL